MIGILVTIPFGWRMAYVVALIPVIFGLIAFVGLIPESARYLIQKGRLAEPEKTVAAVERAALGRRYASSAVADIGAPSAVASGAAPLPAPQPRLAMGTALKTVLQPGQRGATLTVIPMWILPYLFATTTISTILLPDRVGIGLAAVLAALGTTAVLGPVANFISGFLCDWVGSRKIIVLSLLVPAVATWAACTLAHDFTSLVIFYGLFTFTREI